MIFQCLINLSIDLLETEDFQDNYVENDPGKYV